VEEGGREEVRASGLCGAVFRNECSVSHMGQADFSVLAHSLKSQ